MSKVKIKIDGREVEAEEGQAVLWAALDNGFFIPHLCACRQMDYEPGSCRLCMVEVEGRPGPVPSCKLPVEEGMEITTRSERIDRLVRTGFELLMSNHRLNCKDCPANKNCALQEIAKKRKVTLKSKRLVKLEPEREIDDSREDFGLDVNHCILCGRCVYVCNHVEKCRVLDFIKRGLKTVVGTFDGEPLTSQENCTGCLKCVEVCPVGALYFKGDKQKTDVCS